MAKPPPKVDQQRLLAWVERVAAFFAEHFGLPPITGRILGWLMVCDPPEQSGGEIAAAIGASRASITTNMRILMAGELVRRGSRPGERTTYYRIDDDAWERVIRHRIASMASFRDVTEDGIKLLGDDAKRAARVRAAHDFFEWARDLFANTPPPSRKR